MSLFRLLPEELRESKEVELTRRNKERRRKVGNKYLANIGCCLTYNNDNFYNTTIKTSVKSSFKCVCMVIRGVGNLSIKLFQRQN